MDFSSKWKLKEAEAIEWVREQDHGCIEEYVERGVTVRIKLGKFDSSSSSRILLMQSMDPR